MTKRSVLALGLAAALAVVPFSSSARPPADDLTPPEDPYTSEVLKIWLQEGSAPQSVLDRVNGQFLDLYPNVDIQIELQPWEGILERQAKAFKRGSTPCVAELGNTHVTGFAGTGFLTDLTAVAAELGEENWITGMAKVGLLDGKRWSAPFYGGTRVVLYNREHFAQAGVEVPDTLKEFLVLLEQLSEAKGTPATGYSPFYFPGRDVYSALPFVWGLGGDIARYEGDQWKGRLADATSREGLDVLKGMVERYSTAPRDADATGNAEAFASGNVGTMIDLWWVARDIVKLNPDLVDKIGVFALPGVTRYENAPVFMGGSELAIPKKCKDKGLAMQWIKLMTNEENQTFFAEEGLVIPNNFRSFVGVQALPELLTASDAATVAFFTPITVKWPLVEAEEVLPNMLERIFTGDATVDDATAEANARVESILNDVRPGRGRGR